MAVEITKVYTETLPALRFIGKQCLCEPKDFGKKWDEGLENGWFEQLEKLGVAPENGDMYLGATLGDTYWIGLLFPTGTQVPKGFEYVDNSETKYAIFRFEGKKDKELLSEDGITLIYDEMKKHNMVPDIYGLCIERYNKPISNKDSKILLDCLHKIK
jgi:predicted transcriptional regulator YdeE